MLTAIRKGHIYWLPDTPESRSASIDRGKLNHPVLVLGAESAGSVQALVITSLGSTSLSDKFPNPNDRRRRKYLPLRIAGAAPHPDNGILLSVISGQPPILTRASYVNLEPFDVGVRFLRSEERSTCFLPDDMLQRLMDKLLELYPGFVPHRDTPVARRQPPPPPVARPQLPPPPVARPQPSPPVARRQPPPPVARPQPSPPVTRYQPSPPVARPQPSPSVTRYQQSPPVARPPPLTQQSALLSSQRTHSSPYGATPSRQDYHRDLEWNAPRQPTYRTNSRVPEEPDYCEVSVWDILGYLGVAAGLFVSVWYLLH